MRILPTAKWLAKWMAYLGLVCGVLYSVIGLIIDLRTTGVNWGTAMAFMAPVIMPVVFGAFGFLCGALVALLRRGRDCVVVAPHRSHYPDSICLAVGDPVVLGRRDDRYPGWIWVVCPDGNEGWAPESLLRIETKDSGVATSAYTARELDTRAGERLSCKSELHGWLWVENERGKSGWVPKDTVKPV